MHSVLNFCSLKPLSLFLVAPRSLKDARSNQNYHMLGLFSCVVQLLLMRSWKWTLSSLHSALRWRKELCKVPSCSFKTTPLLKLPYEPVIPLLGICSKKAAIWKDTCTPMFTAAIFTVIKIWKQSKCPATDEWIKKMWYILNNGILLSHKNEWNDALCSNMGVSWECNFLGSVSWQQKFEATNVKALGQNVSQLLDRSVL